ncbi:MAG: 2-C-methyl-D-erythritol 4-phosphate cytidylyltransferase [Clostridia bacterium]|nr:2-C-methyl-D-erythritol 4-phosphate cytidylyltransferase [Clostridia bacterium]
MGFRELLKKAAHAVSPRQRTTALILAAGSGTRFGERKQFTEILGVPVLLRTALTFDACPLIDEVIVVTGEEDITSCREMLEGRIGKLTKVVAGGATRQESAMAGLEEVDPKSDFIAIHDAARCLVTVDVIEKVLHEAYETGAAAAAEKAVDTVKFADGNGVITETIDRDHVWLMKTPQIFDANMYRAAVYSAYKDKVPVTDDCMLVERLGFRIKAVDCGRENIKITYAEDKIIAEAILTSREERKNSEE